MNGLRIASQRVSKVGGWSSNALSHCIFFYFGSSSRLDVRDVYREIVFLCIVFVVREQFHTTSVLAASLRCVLERRPGLLT